MRRHHDAGGEVAHVRGHRHLADQLAIAEHLGAAHHALDDDLPRLRGAVDDRVQLLDGRIAHAQLEEEAVELGLRQRVRALHLDRVLRRQDEERRGQRARDAPHGHRRLLHALQQRRLRLGRRPVDLVGQHDVGEERTLLELEVLPTVGVLDDDVGPDDVGGHQVGGELDARERQLETLRQRLDEERLAEARHALEQHVAAREHADEDVVDDLAVTDDDLLDLRAQRLERGDEFPNPAVVGHRVSSLWMTSPGATTPGPIIICKRHATPRLLTRARKRAPARSQDGRAPRRHGARCPSRERAYSQLPVAAASGRRVGSTVTAPCREHARGSRPSQARTGINRR